MIEGWSIKKLSAHKRVDINDVKHVRYLSDHQIMYLVEENLAQCVLEIQRRAKIID